MKLYLAPESSLSLIRYLRSVNMDEGLGGTPMRQRLLNDAVNTVRELEELDVTAQGWLGHAGDPVRAFVPQREKGTSTKHLVTQVYSKAIPHGAFLDLGHGVCICSPQFLLMRMSKGMDLVSSVSLGMELCGSYSRWRLEPAYAGPTSQNDAEGTRSCTFNVPPAVRPQRIEAFVKRMHDEKGVRSATAALRWILGGSASPMETATYLLLCLPKRVGGYGLPQPVLNPKIIVQSAEGPTNRYPDLFWPGANIDVEYNSDSEHSGEWARYRDSRREVELTVANVRVLPLTRLQLMDTDGFDAFAQGIRRMLGIRARAADGEWIRRRGELRSRLLREWSA